MKPVTRVTKEVKLTVWSSDGAVSIAIIAETFHDALEKAKMAMSKLGHNIGRVEKDKTVRVNFYNNDDLLSAGYGKMWEAAYADALKNLRDSHNNVTPGSGVSKRPVRRRLGF